MHSSLECSFVQPTVENSVKIPQKIKNETSLCPEILLLGMYLKKPETLIQKNISNSMLIAVLYTIVKNGSSPSVHQYING